MVKHETRHLRSRCSRLSCTASENSVSSPRSTADGEHGVAGSERRYSLPRAPLWGCRFPHNTSIIGGMSTPLPSSSADRRIRDLLLPGEHLLWTGGPDPRVRFTAMDGFIVPFSVLWCGFAIFWVINATRSAGIGFASFGLLFVAAGLYLVFGRFIYKSHRKRVTAYAVTDRRVITATGKHSTSQAPVRDQPMTIRHQGTHVSVVIGPPARFQQTAYANTGLDFWARDTGNTSLWDVESPEPLLAALQHAQSR